MCALTWSKTEVTWSLRNARADDDDRRQKIRELLAGRTAVAAIAVDGPLRPGLTNLVEHRACEAILSRGPLQKRGKPGSTRGGSGPRLHSEATRLANTAMELCTISARDAPTRVHETRVVEAFPNLFLGTLLDIASYPSKPERKRKWTDTLYPLVSVRLRALLSHLLPNRILVGPFDIADHEQIAALACAVTALCAAAGQYTAVGALGDGFILLPPPAFLGDGWSADLHTNVSRSRRDFPSASLYVGRVAAP